MTMLLAADVVELYPAGEVDGHGWRLPGEGHPPSWCGLGNLQLITADSDPRAAGGGGRGPHAPHSADLGNLYLPVDAGPVNGMAALVRGQVYLLSQVRQVADPVLGAGAGISCWAATVTAAPDV